MAASEAIHIGGHPLSGLLHGATYRVNRLAGWWERPVVKRASMARELADGDFPAPWHFEARRIGIDGHIHAAEHGQMHHIMDQLNGLCATGREWLTIQGHGPTTAALVEADDQPYFLPITDRIMRFELRFKANDPRRYGDMHRVLINHNSREYRHWGNYPAPVEAHLTAYGAEDGFRVVANVGGRNRFWEYEQNAWSSQEHVADFYHGVHLVDGEQTPGRLGRAHTWTIPPRQAVTAVSEALGAGNADGWLIFRDTYI